MVGDGGTPNLFFVSTCGVIVAILRNGEVAHQMWLDLRARNYHVPACLEDRRNGVLCDYDEMEQLNADGSTIKRWCSIDDYHKFV